MDSIDRKLLNLLQEDSKQTTKELANSLNLSVTAVYERIRKLEKNKIIKKYVALIDYEKVNRDFVVLCHVKLLQHKKEYLMQFEKEVMQLREVMDCFHVSGDYDYILKIAVSNIKEYRQFVVTKLTSLQHIGSSHSSFVIGEIKSTTAMHL
ncbi:Lrp/AsnC family transcriptional regulator [Chryseobacterium sp. T1]